MLFPDYPDAYNLRYNVHVLNIYANSVLSFAKELIDQDLAELGEDDKAIVTHLAGEMKRMWFEAEMLSTRVEQGG